MDYQHQSTPSNTRSTIKTPKNHQKNINIINLLNEKHDTTRKGNQSIPIDILDDLSSRFIINLPNEERDDIVRILFQVELAHWFYTDFYLVECPDLIKYNLNPFARLMFKHVPSLRQYLDSFDEVFDKWRDYKHNVPTYGALILDEAMENVLMVQGFWTNTTWGFPKGKINEQEDPLVCACREVKEEIGFDCASLIDSDQFIETQIRDTYIRLYIIAGVSKNENFQTQTRNEIKKIQWFAIKDLPSSKQEKELNPNAFFMVIPIIKSLKRWIYERRSSNSDFQNSFNHSLHSGRIQNSCSPASNKYSKENHYHNSSSRNSTAHHNQQSQIGVNSNRTSSKFLFNPNDKITILKNNSHNITSKANNCATADKNISKQRAFWSKTLVNFNLNFDDLWKEAIDSL